MCRGDQNPPDLSDFLPHSLLLLPRNPASRIWAILSKEALTEIREVFFKQQKGSQGRCWRAQTDPHHHPSHASSAHAEPAPVKSPSKA